ncbi:hypothetical protein ACFQZO_27635 [Bradyrhizobium sp. GCM10027634]|uniref:hypothetical protein n=1 Tax=unclassified Bradyrhizobium TaxID=2631580 RepID=UPI00188B4ECC|nr:MULTISPECIES: hypothetical protein [unclassified Bradyrhizobium]MDN5004626.1 hypothetical protein [Bradyrhizobium sp. WYCCWR 12677]
MERRSARRRPNHFIGRARANVPARGASPLLAPPRSPQDGDKVRAETIARRIAICRTVVSVGGRMTVYLISLALAGLVAIVVWEIFA